MEKLQNDIVMAKMIGLTTSLSLVSKMSELTRQLKN